VSSIRTGVLISP